MFKLWPLLLLFFSTSAHAVDWIFRNTFESYLYYNYANPLDNDVNPGNHVFALPSGTGVVDLRDDFSLLTRDTKWVVRPRWTLTNTKIEMKDPTDSSSTTRGKMDLTAGYLDWDLSKTWKAVLGLQVYQWGPGEFMNPSNVFFHFSSDARSFSFVQKGLVMARLNWTPSERWNFVFMSEPVSNNEPSFQAEKPFEPKSTLKVEYRGASNSFLGAVAGTEAPETLFFGEYFDWYVTDSFSLYADIRHTSSNNVYDPLDDGMGNIQLVQQDPAFGQMTTIA
ncbi:MAG TPA: hypothetical protein VN132_11345, partial [Bdellovibrio sp.]|nr:hypothetical protein [Bdellovibrio sp.]